MNAIKPFKYHDVASHLMSSQRTGLEQRYIAGAALERDSSSAAQQKPFSFPQQQWLDHGFVIAPRLIPDNLIQEYMALWVRENTNPGGMRWGGFPTCTPYMEYPEIRNLALYRGLSDILEEVIGTPMGMHLNLTGWVSTERDFHQDIYLNPPNVGTHYAAVWIALEDVDPASGPFEYVPGSHKWPAIQMKQLFDRIPKELHSDPAWPRITQSVVAKACEEEIARRDVHPIRFLAKAGDVLVWHPCLMHRGTVPTDQNKRRKAFIAHFSAIDHRPDFPASRRENHGWYFPIENGGPV